MNAHRLQWTVLLGALLAASVSAQSIDYDPRRAATLRSCDEHQHRGRIEQAKSCYARLLDAPDAIVQAEAAWALGDLQRANLIFRRLVQEDARVVLPRIRWARLFLQTHQYDDAVELFQQALQIFPQDAHAKLGLARVFAERFEGEARPLLAAVLQQDDELIEAYLLNARMALEEGQFESAEQALERAARIASERRLPPLEVYALRAALQAGRNRDPAPWIARALDYNPRYAAVYEQLAHYEIMRRRYREAADLLRTAVMVQPQSWSAHAELGLNLLRLGEIEQARAHLQRAYSGDPYSPTTVNSLRLLDRLAEFDVASIPLVSGAGTVVVRLRLHRDEAPVLQPYAIDLVRQAIGTFSQRYGFELREPLTIELYPDHDDFAVRVAALPGIGLLGVTFGSVVAMDSPAGRPKGEFHWGSTLWHELAHVFTLQVTGHRVPRWLSEGIAVFEEWRTGPTPGVFVPPDAMAALRAGRFLPVAELDTGFIRPRYPGQIQVSYVQSGLVCLFIEQRWGFEHLTMLLRQFQREVSTAAALEATFKMSPSAFDAELVSFLRTRYAALLANMDEWERQYQAARRALQSEQWSNAVGPARRAAQLYPEHTGPGSPNLLLARALDKLGRRAEALAALTAYRSAGGWEPAALRELAYGLDAAGHGEEATRVWHALNYVDPLSPEQHARLAERLLTHNRPQEALREFRVLHALTQADPAQALYGAARALLALGDRAGSRRQVLDALAAAPHYKPAQDLLLQIVKERTNNE